MKVFLGCLIFLFGFGCKDTEEKPKEKKELIMVKPSEMANLMNEMYAYNLSLQQEVKDGEIINEFPERFLNIHSARLTDSRDRDSLFEVNSGLFIKTQKALFKSDSNNLLNSYNNVVNACISCHEVTCMGPIPKIKKLYIK